MFILMGHAAYAKMATPTYRVGIYQNPPKIFHDDAGNAAGFFPELIDELARLRGFNVTYVPCEWAACLDRLEKGSLDIMPDVAWSEQRSERFRFGYESIMHSWSFVYRRPGIDVQKQDDFAGRRIAVLRGSFQLRKLIDLAAGLSGQFETVLTDSHEATLDAVATGLADIGIVNQFFGATAEGKFDIERTPIIFAPASVFLAFSNEFPASEVQMIDIALTGLKADAKSPYYRSKSRWLDPLHNPALPDWAIWLVLSIAATLLLSVAVIAYLRRAVASKTRQYLQAAAAAEAANDTKSKFLAHVSHELRTPLNAILGFSEILGSRHLGPLPQDKYREYAQDISNSAAHLLELVNGLLDLSVIEAGNSFLDKKPVSIADLVTGCLRLIEVKAAEKSIRLQLIMRSDLPQLVADQRALKQILINLLGNAVKFTPAGGEVRVSVEDSETHIRFTVSDTGVGISADNLQTVSNALSMGKRDPYKTSTGWGLGLTIARSLVELHGGEMIVESVVGTGTSVTVVIPREPGED